MKKKEEPEAKRRRKTRSDSAASHQDATQSMEGVEEKKSTKRTEKSLPRQESASKQDELSVDQLEEYQAEQRDSQNDAEIYKNTCAEIERLVTEINELKIKGRLSDVSEKKCSFTFYKINPLSLIN